MAFFWLCYACGLYFPFIAENFIVFVMEHATMQVKRNGHQNIMVTSHFIDYWEECSLTGPNAVKFPAIFFFCNQQKCSYTYNVTVNF